VRWLAKEALQLPWLIVVETRSERRARHLSSRGL